MKRTRQREIMEREAMERLSDRLSDLPDCVLLHIMEFMNAKYAVQTCVLSKRWKDLWKRLTILTMRSWDFRRHLFFNKFVSLVLSRRDDSISLHNLYLSHGNCTQPKLLNRVMTYAVSHDVQQLMINIDSLVKKDFELPSCVFYCRSLTILKLWFPCFGEDKIKLPKSLELPALKSLHMEHVTFATSDNGFAEPFSKCHMLNTLVIGHCYLQKDAKVLCISNSKLFSLTINFYNCCLGKVYEEITLLTPNLNLLTIKGDPVYQLSSTSNITCLEEVNIDISADFDEDFETNGLVLISWLQVLVNVKIMTLTWRTFQILNDLSSRRSVRTQLPCFVRLKSLKLDSYITDEEASRVVEYMLQNSPLTKVDIIKLTLEGF